MAVVLQGRSHVPWTGMVAVEIEIMARTESCFELAWSFPPSSPLSLSLFLFWLSFLGEKSSLCSCQGYVLWRTYLPQMVFGILAKRVAGQPLAPRVFWKQFNNGHLLITMTTMSFDSLSFKTPLVIASYFTPPTHPRRCVAERDKDFSLSFIIEWGKVNWHPRDHTKDVGLGIGIQSLTFRPHLVNRRPYTNSPCTCLQTTSSWVHLSNLQDLSFPDCEGRMKIKYLVWTLNLTHSGDSSCLPMWIH